MGKNVSNIDGCTTSHGRCSSLPLAFSILLLLGIQLLANNVRHVFLRP
jgi:hypothetical protein